MVQVKKHTRKRKNGVSVVRKHSRKKLLAKVIGKKDMTPKYSKNSEVLKTLESDFSEADYPGRKITHYKDHAIVKVPKGGTWRVNKNGSYNSTRKEKK